MNDSRLRTEKYSKSKVINLIFLLFEFSFPLIFAIVYTLITGIPISLDELVRGYNAYFSSPVIVMSILVILVMLFV